MNIVHSLTLGEKELLEEALELLEEKIKQTSNDYSATEKHYNLVDIEVIKAYLRYNVNISMTKKQFDNFTYTNGVDFPEYNII
jgi:predicted transport protein